MSECNEHIALIYQHPKLIELVRKIKPVELQDDLLQEMAIVLLEYDCKKLLMIASEGQLLHFAMTVLWKMGTLQNGNFFRTYRKSHINEAIEYLRTNQGQEIPHHYIADAKKILENKLNSDANEAHEFYIFSKYVELQSCQKVADYFGLPRLHVFQVVNNVKKELKKKIRK